MMTQAIRKNPPLAPCGAAPADGLAATELRRPAGGPVARPSAAMSPERSAAAPASSHLHISSRTARAYVRGAPNHERILTTSDVERVVKPKGARL